MWLSQCPAIDISRLHVLVDDATKQCREERIANFSQSHGCQEIADGESVSQLDRSDLEGKKEPKRRSVALRVTMRAGEFQRLAELARLAVKR